METRLLIKTLLELAHDEIGTTEVAGSNCGVRVNQYKGATNLDAKKSWPWCAAFVCWLIREALLKLGFKPAWKRPVTAGAFDFENWAKRNSSYVELIEDNLTFQPGDIVIFNFSHIGLCVSYEKDGYIYVVEGNTNGSGSREGGEVYKQHRKTSLVRSVIRFKDNQSKIQIKSKYIKLIDWCNKNKVDIASVKVPSRYYDAAKETTYALSSELEDYIKEVELSAWCQENNKNMTDINVPSRYYDKKKETTYARLYELKQLL